VRIDSQRYPWVTVPQLLLHDCRGCTVCKQSTDHTATCGAESAAWYAQTHKQRVQNFLSGACWLGSERKCHPALGVLPMTTLDLEATASCCLRKKHVDAGEYFSDQKWACKDSPSQRGLHRKGFKNSLGLLRGMIYLGVRKVRTERPNDGIICSRFCQG